MTHSYDIELQALKLIYDTLRPFGFHERDRIVRAVLDRLSRERSAVGLPQSPARPVNVDPIPLGEARKR